MVSIKVDMDGLDFKQEKQKEVEKPTYDNIKRWVKAKYGFEVTSLYIAQVKGRVSFRIALRSRKRRSKMP